MTRSNAKVLITLLSIVANSTRHEQQLFIDELKNVDLEFLISLEGALHNLSYDLDELTKEKAKNETRYTIPDDSFDRFGY